MKVSWMRRAGVVFAAAAVGIVVNAGVASAGDGVARTSDGSGGASWWEYGDELRVCDLEADGWGVRAYIYEPDAPGSTTGTVLMKASDPSHEEGENNCVPVSKNIDEYIHISLKVCNYKGTSIINCGYNKHLR